MQPLARIANQAGQAMFDIQVHIFQIERPGKAAAFDFLRNLCHAAFDVGQVLGADDVLTGQHARMRQRTADILPPQALIEIDRGGIAFDQIGHGFVKTASPSIGRGGLGLFVAGHGGGRQWLKPRIIRDGAC